MEDADFLTAFALSTWFVDCYRVSPCLHLTGSGIRAHIIMRLLACICRRSVMIGRLDIAALRTLPKGLEPTILIHDENISKNVERLLTTSKNRELGMPVGKNWIYCSGPSVIFSGSKSLDVSALKIHFAPSLAAPELREEVQETIATDFQAKLLRYRMVKYNEVRGSKEECLEFALPMRNDARALIVPLIENADLAQSVSSSLHSQNKESTGARFTDLNCLVIEAALHFCHDPNREAFFVKEVADAVNAILFGRHEEGSISNKLVGLTLHNLGLFTERVTKGYRVLVTDKNRKTIHRLAIEYNVVTILSESVRCDLCAVPPEDSKSDA